MAIRLSTAARIAMVATPGLAAALTNGKMKIFSGSQPTSADNAEQGTLLLEITIDAGAFVHGAPGNGLNFESGGDGSIDKASGEIWRGLGLVEGRGGWFRFVANPDDDGAARTDLNRIDGTVGLSGSGADGILSIVDFTVAQSVTCDKCKFTMPAA